MSGWGRIAKKDKYCKGRIPKISRISEATPAGEGWEEKKTGQNIANAKGIKIFPTFSIYSPPYQESLIKDHRVSEEEKRLMVDQAVSDLMARDTQYREELRIEVNKKLEKAAVNKNLQDTKKYQTIAESNRYHFNA